MMMQRALILALTASSTTRAFLTPLRPSTTARPAVSSSWRLFTASASSSTSQDTPVQLPEFTDKDAYLAYMESVAALPKGFATGTADGKFVSVEAPAMGALPIRGTVIHLTEGPTESWAAVFTKNKVCAS